MKGFIMKKLLESLVFIVALGIAGSALALVDAPTTLHCNEEELVCVEDEAFEITLNCYAISPTKDLLEIEDFGDNWGFNLEVEDDDPVFLCSIEGEFDELKTEVKCTSRAKGPNKDRGSPQVDMETKRKPGYDSLCPAGV
jgi:hypothetical protein